MKSDNFEFPNVSSHLSMFSNTDTSYSTSTIANVSGDNFGQAIQHIYNFFNNNFLNDTTAPDHKKIKLLSEVTSKLCLMHNDLSNKMLDSYVHNLMYRKEGLESKEKVRGYYLYRDESKVYVMVVHTSELHETLCLTDIATKRSERNALNTIDWPKENDEVVNLDDTLVALITSHCRNPFFFINRNLVGEVTMNFCVLRHKIDNFSIVLFIGEDIKLRTDLFQAGKIEDYLEKAYNGINENEIIKTFATNPGNEEILFTGFSVGASLASIAGICFDRLTFAFEPFGIRHIKQQFSPQLSNPKIINYLTTPNAVTTRLEQLGTIYRIRLKHVDSTSSLHRRKAILGSTSRLALYVALYSSVFLISRTVLHSSHANAIASDKILNESQANEAYFSANDAYIKAENAYQDYRSYHRVSQKDRKKLKVLKDKKFEKESLQITAKKTLLLAQTALTQAQHQANAARAIVSLALSVGVGFNISFILAVLILNFVNMVKIGNKNERAQLFELQTMGEHDIGHISNALGGYPQNLLCSIEMLEGKKNSRGYHLYPNKNQVYVMVVHAPNACEILCLSKLATKKEEREALARISWPLLEERIDNLNESLVALIKTNCIYNCLFEIETWPLTLLPTLKDVIYNVGRHWLPFQQANAGIHNYNNEDDYKEGLIKVMSGYKEKNTKNTFYNTGSTDKTFLRVGETLAGAIYTTFVIYTIWMTGQSEAKTKAWGAGFLVLQLMPLIFLVSFYISSKRPCSFPFSNKTRRTLIENETGTGLTQQHETRSNEHHRESGDEIDLDEVNEQHPLNSVVI